MGVGGRGKCPGAPSHHLRRQRNKEIGMENDSRPKGTVKSLMAKNGNGKWNKRRKKECKRIIATGKEGKYV
jgi:hypothetical protein